MYMWLQAVNSYEYRPHLEVGHGLQSCSNRTQARRKRLPWPACMQQGDEFWFQHAATQAGGKGKAAADLHVPLVAATGAQADASLEVRGLSAQPVAG